MAIRVGINGMGRIGRVLMRVAARGEDLEVVAVNDVAQPEQVARLLHRDSTFGVFGKEVRAEDGQLWIDGTTVAISQQPDPGALAWGDHGVDVVVDATGRFRTREQLSAHLDAGAPAVVLSAPGKGVDKTFVMGVNDDEFDPDAHVIVSNASCTTNCVAPMVKVLHDAFGVQQGFMTTVHAYTGDQNLQDAPHKDPRRARSAAVNIVPTTTGAARAVGEVIPAVAGRLSGLALRVPVLDGSLVDLAVLLDREVEEGQVLEAYAAAAVDGPLAGRLRYEEEPLVSSDIVGDPASCIFDSALTDVSGAMVKVFGWYDNEWGYSARLAELARLVGAGR